MHGGQNLIRPVGRDFCLLCSMCTPAPPFMGSVSFLYNEAAQSLGPISASASGVHNGNCQHLGFGEKRGW